ncbi:hypothetical protein KP509_31G023300 [Ceratopteris richardii]|uniref:Uncharacterized protein n=1 Tax=Ceratopteris richardii TaxID=49495 RepID=A0A8T2QW75_CERRI|nr:hypothetical protein KP509_31G023300 [Ceratopteris richardii]
MQYHHDPCSFRSFEITRQTFVNTQAFDELPEEITKTFISPSLSFAGKWMLQECRKVDAAGKRGHDTEVMRITFSEARACTVQSSSWTFEQSLRLRACCYSLLPKLNTQS